MIRLSIAILSTLCILMFAACTEGDTYYTNPMTPDTVYVGCDCDDDCHHHGHGHGRKHDDCDDDDYHAKVWAGIPYAYVKVSKK